VKLSKRPVFFTGECDVWKVKQAALAELVMIVAIEPCWLGRVR
jgi:hypothetical protein